MVLEAIQGAWMPGRMFDFADVIADAGSGVLPGSVLEHLWSQAGQNRKRLINFTPSNPVSCFAEKTPQADLENKRSTWRALGFVASLSLILSALAWTSYDVAITRAIDFEADLLEDEEIPVNVVTPPPPPPPPSKQR